MTVHITDHARKRMADRNIREGSAIRLFNKAVEVKLLPFLWGAKFREHGISGLRVSYRYYSGWLFICDGDKLVTLYDGVRERDLMFN